MHFFKYPHKLKMKKRRNGMAILVATYLQEQGEGWGSSFLYPDLSADKA